MSAIDRARRSVTFTYRNWRGVIERRHVYPISMIWAQNEWHREEQYLLVAFDLDRKALREFAMSSITDWRPYANQLAVEAQDALADFVGNAGTAGTAGTDRTLAIAYVKDVDDDHAARAPRDTREQPFRPGGDGDPAT